jgi:hypothetical protein
MADKNRGERKPGVLEKKIANANKNGVKNNISYSKFTDSGGSNERFRTIYNDGKNIDEMVSGNKSGKSQWDIEVVTSKPGDRDNSKTTNCNASDKDVNIDAMLKNVVESKLKPNAFCSSGSKPSSKKPKKKGGVKKKSKKKSKKKPVKKPAKKPKKKSAKKSTKKSTKKPKKKSI